MDFGNFLEIEFYWRSLFEILIIHKPSLGSCEITTYNFGLIGSYKQTDMVDEERGRLERVPENSSLKSSSQPSSSAPSPSSSSSLQNIGKNNRTIF